jgi:hypothetical protein
VSRNYDYIYLAGNQLIRTIPKKYRLLFFKLDGYADNLLYNRYVYSAVAADDFSLRRMMLTNPRDVLNGGAVDNNAQYAYFCASYYRSATNDYNFIYGRVDY